MNDSVVDVLKRVRTRLATPNHWTQGENARNGKGHKVEPTDKNAVCWCLDGATQAELGALKFSTLYLDTLICLNETCRELGSQKRFFDWQDERNRTHTEVLALLDKAIHFAEATS